MGILGKKKAHKPLVITIVIFTIVTTATLVYINRSLLLDALNMRSRDKSVTYDMSDVRNIPMKQIKSAMKQKEGYPYEKIYGGSRLDVDTERPIDWSWHYKEKRSDNFHLHSFDMLNSHLSEYDSSKNNSLLRQMINISVDWVRHNPFEKHNNQEGNFAWYDMAVGVRLYRLAYIFDQALRVKTVDEDTLRVLYNSIIDHFVYLQDDNNVIFHNNHGIYQAAGQSAAARRLSIVSPVFTEVRKQAERRINHMLERQFTGEGIHKEHSPDYHRMVYDTFLGLAKDGLMGHGDSDKLLAKAGDGLYWMIKPNGYILGFGDTDVRKVTFDKDIYSKISSQRLKHFIFNSTTGDYPGKKYVLYKDSGFFAVKDRGSYLAQQAAFFSRTHKHADNLSISWYDNGQDILIDAGRYGYQGLVAKDSEAAMQGFWYSDPKRQYVEKTRAHNTVEIDGKDFLRRGAEPFGSAIVDGGEEQGVYYILTRTNEFSTISFQRLVLFKPGKWLVVIDNLHDKNNLKHEYKQWFHLDPSIRLSQADTGFSGEVNGKLLTIASLKGGSVRGPIRGQTKPYLQGWYSPGAYKLEQNDAISFNENGNSAEIVTLFTFDKANEKTKYSGSIAGPGNNAELAIQENGVLKKIRINLEKDDKVTINL